MWKATFKMLNLKSLVLFLLFTSAVKSFISVETVNRTINFNEKYLTSVESIDPKTNVAHHTYDIKKKLDDIDVSVELLSLSF